MEITKALIGKRILYRLKDEYPFLLGDNEGIREGVITEISPDGNYVKIITYVPFRKEAWYEVNRIELLTPVGKVKESREKNVYL